MKSGLSEAPAATASVRVRLLFRGFICTERMQVVLSFPIPRTQPSDAALVILDESRTGIDIEVER